MLIMEVIKSVSFVCRERVFREFLIHGSLECSPIFLYIYIFFYLYRLTWSEQVKFLLTRFDTICWLFIFLNKLSFHQRDSDLTLFICTMSCFYKSSSCTKDGVSYTEIFRNTLTKISASLKQEYYSRSISKKN